MKIRTFIATLALLFSAQSNAYDWNLDVVVLWCGPSADVRSNAFGKVDIWEILLIDDLETRAKLYENGTLVKTSGPHLVEAPAGKGWLGSRATADTPCNATYCNDKSGSSANSYVKFDYFTPLPTIWYRTNIDVQMDCEPNEQCQGEPP